MLEVIVIFATEVCTGSVRYDQCVDWYRNCMLTQLVVAQAWDLQNAGEHCAENLPEWATEGM